MSIKQVILKHFVSLKPFICLLSLAFMLELGAQQQTPFTDYDANTPNYIIIERIVKSKNSMLANEFGSDWKAGDYSKAWKKVGDYFPKKYYYNSLSTNFMHHWFNPQGKMEISIYYSKELEWAVKNLRTFDYRYIVEEYQSMRAASNQKEAAAFKKKLGLLEKYFHNMKSFKELISMLKGARSITRNRDGLIGELFEALRTEGDHMFAAALMHEGMHGLLDNGANAYKINNSFEKCDIPIQWDEFRGYTAEMGYHSNYFKWAKKNIDAHMGAIGKYLDKLDKLRKYTKPLKESQKKKIEKIKARIKAHIAIIRVRLREMQQSIDRMKGLMDFFKKKYFKTTNTNKYKNYKEVKDMVDGLDKKVQDFAKKASKAVKDYEKGLKDLEDMLKKWNEWAACHIEKPPKKEEHIEIKKKFKDVSWPSSPPNTEKEKKVAEKNIRSTSGSSRRRSIAGLSSPGTSGSRDTTISELNKDPFDSGIGVNSSFSISAGVDYSTFDMGELNTYTSYLNDTWDGNIGSIDNGTGYWVSASWILDNTYEFETGYSMFSNSTDGFLGLTGSDYMTENTLEGIDLTFNYNYPITFDRITGQIGIGVGYYWSEYTETENDFVANGSANALGTTASIGMFYSITQNIDVKATVGYRTVNFDDYSDDVMFFQPNNPNVVLNFSGAFGRMGIAFHF